MRSRRLVSARPAGRAPDNAMRHGCCARSRPAARRCARSRRRELAPDVARLSDEHDTRATFGARGGGRVLPPCGRHRLARIALPPRLPARDGAGRVRPGDSRHAGALLPRGCWRVAGALPLGSRAGRGVACGAFHRPAPARRAARPRRDGGDARDRRRAGPGWRACTPRCALRWRTRSLRLRPSSAVTFPTSTRTAPRCTSPCWRVRTRTTRAGGGKWPSVPAGDAIAAAGADDHAPSRGRPRPASIGSRRSMARSVWGSCARPGCVVTPTGS